ncbi:MAG: CYTH domain-containing protein [Eubacteriales bacterium]|nr:CYTH domain-containing protein [Eubacteriales bacterium]MDD4390988.1 CYTH domain-containing protein [Eubacteriales bacterium]
MEIEIKYSIIGHKIGDKLWQDEILANMEDENSREQLFMKSAYFDTDDYVLSENDIAFRVRLENKRVVASLKWGGNSEGALHKRQEINVPMDDEACFLNPDPAVFKESEIGANILRLIDERPLINLMEIHYLRRRFRIDTGSSLIEISIDEGKIVTDNGTEPINEVELELFSGEVEDLLRVGTSLCERYELEEESRSKYARGLNLLNMGKK